jgi:hypothetical protein
MCQLLHHCVNSGRNRIYTGNRTNPVHRCPPESAPLSQQCVNDVVGEQSMAAPVVPDSLLFLTAVLYRKADSVLCIRAAHTALHRTCYTPTLIYSCLHAYHVGLHPVLIHKATAASYSL